MNAVLTPEDIGKKEPAAVRQDFVMPNRLGLHCRPAALLINTLKGMVCQVTVQSGGEAANGRSIFDLMSLAVGYQTKLTVTITGPDAKKAMTAIQRLFDTKFADAYDENHPLSHKQMRAF